MVLRQEDPEFALNEELPVFKLAGISAHKLNSNENTRVVEGEVNSDQLDFTGLELGRK